MHPRWTILAAAMFALASARADSAEPLSAKATAILQQRCFSCHGEKTAMSDLRLNDREQALRGGNRGPAIEPGHANDSLLFQAVSHIGKVAMPPGAKIPNDEIETLRAWIDKGAEWPRQSIQAQSADWWALHQPHRPAVPEITGAKIVQRQTPQRLGPPDRLAPRLASLWRKVGPPLARSRALRRYRRFRAG